MTGDIQRSYRLQTPLARAVRVYPRPQKYRGSDAFGWNTTWVSTILTRSGAHRTIRPFGNTQYRPCSRREYRARRFPLAQQAPTPRAPRRRGGRLGVQITDGRPTVSEWVEVRPDVNGEIGKWHYQTLSVNGSPVLSGGRPKINCRNGGIKKPFSRSIDRLSYP
jgi:hypothetical protein